MRKEGEMNYDSGKIVRILIIAILIVLILIIGSLVYVFMSGDEKPVNLPNATFVDYSQVYQSENIVLCHDDSDKKRENYCKINFAQVSGNSSICSLLDESVTFPYISKVKKLNLNLSAVDFCYITLSKSESKNYCPQIKDETGRIVCMEDLA